jgi:stage II sporulation protein D
MALAMGISLLGATSANAADVPSSFTITGSGHGHGVGLSQYGAQGMAAYGAKTAEEIVTYYYQGTTVSEYDYTANPNIKVSVEGDTPMMALRFEDDPSNTNAVAVQPAITIGGVAVPGVTYDVDYTFVLSGTSYVLSGAGITTVTASTTATITWDNASTLANVNGGPIGSTSIGMLGLVGSCSTSNCVHRYKYGTIDIFVSALKPGVVVDRDLQAVNTMKLNTEYLYGIGEVPSSWHAEALKAQVIAARTYGTRKQIDFPSADRDDCGCQIFSSTVDQNYVGFSKEYLASGSAWVAAVNATLNQTDANKGKVILNGTDVITGYYTASTGGKTQPKNEWGSGSATYLVSVDDPYSLDPRVGNSLSSWSVTITQADLVSRLAGQGVSVSNVASFEITEKYASGGAKKLTLTDSNGTATVLTIAFGQPVTPDELRTLLRSNSTYLSAITWTPVVAASTPTPTPTPTVAAPAPAAPAPAAPAVSTPSVSTPTATATKKVNSITSVSWQSSKVRRARPVVTGKVSPVMSGVAVKLQVLQNSQWVTIASDTTGKKGVWSLRWSSIKTGTHKFRVVAASAVNTVSTKTKSLKVTKVL